MKDLIKRLRKGVPYKTVRNDYTWRKECVEDTRLARSIMKEAADALERMQWDPDMEACRSSLPDSRSRLIWCPDNRCTYAVTWRDGEDGDKKGWHTFGGRWCSDAQNPSHWRHLPSPPE